MGIKDSITVLTTPNQLGRVIKAHLFFKREPERLYYSDRVNFMDIPHPASMTIENTVINTIVAEFVMRDSGLYEGYLNKGKSQAGNELVAEIIFSNTPKFIIKNASVLAINRKTNILKIIGDFHRDPSIPLNFYKYTHQTAEEFNENMLEKVEKDKPYLKRFRSLLED